MKRRVLLLAGVVLFLLLLPRPSGAGAAEEEIVLSLSTDEKTVVLGREIPLRVGLRKKRGRPLRVNALRLARNSITLLVSRAGETHRITRIHGSEVHRPDGTFAIEDDPPPGAVLRRGRPLQLQLPVLALLTGDCTIRAVYAGLGPEAAPLTSAPVTVSIEAAEDRDRIGATIETSEGTMFLELWPEKAFGTVWNFLTLARAGRYDGLTFHRVLEGHLIQGGDPKGDGTGRPDWSIPGEFREDLLHVRGVLSMARASPLPDSGANQFFIMHGADKRLDGRYAAFGRVTRGLDVLDRLASVPVVANLKSGEVSLPEDPPIIRSIRVVTR